MDIKSVVENDSARNPRRERRLWHQPVRGTESLGCAICPEWQICGGLRLETSLFDCLQFCCGDSEGCDRVCRNHPDYPDRVREIQTFDLRTVPRAEAVAAPKLPRVVPILYHRSGRTLLHVRRTVALPLCSQFDRRTGLPRFATHDALCNAFGIVSGSTILLTGTDRDPPLERWWELGEDGRRKIIRTMKKNGIGLVTTPNYSLFIDRPRWDDLHAMKRIASVCVEFLDEGLPAALHVNGRTEWDFRRWFNYISDRPEITHLAYEFTTGTGWAGRREQHAIWLSELAANVGRPLHIVVRGGLEVLPLLVRSFAEVTVLDASIFMKTINRQRAYPKSNSSLGWTKFPTELGAPLYDLFAGNCQTVETWLGDLITSSVEGDRMVG